MNVMHRFWDVVTRSDGARVRIDGPIAADEDLLFGDEVTPMALREALKDQSGDLQIYINSPGGDVVAATQIYTMLSEYKGTVTVKIDGIAASAASIIAMAGDVVLMAPTAYMMIHNASSVALGNKYDMEHEASVLEEVDKGIRTAYMLRTGLSERKLAAMMDEETWISAAAAIEMGFADGYITSEEPEEEEKEEENEPAREPLEEPEEEPEEEEKEEQRAAAYYRLPAVAYSAKDSMERMLERELKKHTRRDGVENARKEAAAEESAEAIQRLRLKLLSY